MAVYKKNNRWYIDYYQPDGKRKREVVTIQGVDPKHVNRQDAHKALSIRKAQIAEGKFEIAHTKKPILFDKFVERYLEYSKANKRSWTRDVVSSKSLLKTFGGKNLGQINSWLVEKYKVERSKEISRYRRLITKSSVNREIACLKHMFTKAIEWGLITSSPARNVKLFRVQPNKLRVLSNEEFQNIYNEASEFLRPILLFALNTGMRQGEILKLRWDDINLNQEYINVRDTKNNESRNIPINETLKIIIDSLKKNSDNEYVFAYKNGEPVRSVKTAFYSALRRSKIDKCRFHDLRHTFATRLVMAGVDIVTVKELLGHKDISMTMRYSHPTPQHKQHAVEKINISVMDTYLDTNTSNANLKTVVTP
ncbi:site-specific integrase [Desulfobacterota bacterium AH_259_B03_O07]|nr:site-specific integrase [Desulfobacterota bacterium AH_259_B03_O07]